MEVESQDTLNEVVDRAKAAMTDVASGAIAQIQPMIDTAIDRAMTEIGNISRGAITDLTAAVSPFSVELKRFNDNIERMLNAGIDVGGLLISLGKQK